MDIYAINANGAGIVKESPQREFVSYSAFRASALNVVMSFF